MAARATSEAERRSKVAEACVDFGRHLLQVRISSVSADDAQRCVKDLFDWFSGRDAFSEANAGIAAQAVAFGKQLLESRKSATVDEAIRAIQNVFLNLAD